MIRPILILIFSLIFLMASVSSSQAGRKYYGSRYHHGYSHHSYAHHGYHHRYYHSSNDAWVYLGVGLLTGVIFSTLLNPQPREKTVVYRTPPQIHVVPQPRSSPRVLSTYRPPEHILGQVETTAHVLNIRFTPDVNASVTGQLIRGSLLNVIGVAPGWLYVKTADGQYGWILERFTMPADTPVG